MKIFNYFVFFFLIVTNACGKGNGDHDKKNDNNHSDKKTVKVLSYNIRHGAPIHQRNEDVRIEGIAAVINRVKPDLVALQEVDSVTKRAPFDQARQLGEMTGMHFFFAKAIDYQGGGYGIAVLSRYPILSAQKIALPMPDKSGEARAVAMIKIDIDSVGSVYFASSHLDLKEENRVAQINKLMELSVDKDAPLIIAGDFNAKPDAAEIQKLQQEYTAPCSSNCPKTFPSDKPDRTIDYIMLNPKASDRLHPVIYKAIPGVLASDHLPLYEELEIK